MRQAFCYLRISSSVQLDGFGLDRQEQECRKWAKDNGHEIVQTFKEVVSGTTDETERPAFQGMMSEILNNGVKTIIVEGLDRLARRLRIQETLVVYLASKDVDLISARTGENVTEAFKEDGMRLALIQMQGVFAQLEKSQMLRRLRKGKERARQEGRRTDGQRPYGEGSETEKQVIHKIRLWRRARKLGQHPMTLQAIADRLNAEGLKTKWGKPWTAQLVAHFAKGK